MLAVEPADVLVALQALVVNTLELPIQPEVIDADRPIGAMAIACGGAEYPLDSVDLVQIVAAIEDSLNVDLLDDPAVTQVMSNGSLRAFADYIAGQASQNALAAFCGPSPSAEVRIDA